MTKLTKTKERKEEPPQQTTENTRLKSLAYPLKVVVTPVKTFREIAQNPTVWGFLLIIVLYLLAVAGEQYAKASRIFLDEPDLSTSLLNSHLFNDYLTAGLLQNAISIVISWITYAGLLLLLAKLLSRESKLQRSFLIVSGYAFSTFVIYIAINALVIPTFPEIHFDASAWTSGTPEDIGIIQTGFAEVWGSLLAAEVLTYLSLVFNLWLVTLCAIAVYVSEEIRFAKALMISVAAYFLSVFLTVFFTVLFFGAS